MSAFKIRTYRVAMINSDERTRSDGEICLSQRPEQAIKRAFGRTLIATKLEQITYDLEGFSLFRIIGLDDKPTGIFVSAQEVEKEVGGELTASDLKTLTHVASRLDTAYSTIGRGTSHIAKAAILEAHRELSAFIKGRAE